MRVTNITNNIFGAQSDKTAKTPAPKREFIDKFTDAIQNQRDVNDCVAVPRGIFKAYLFIMAGSALLALSAIAPQKWKIMSKTLAVGGTLLNLISAFYFAKPFAFKGVSPTVDKNTLKPVEVQ